MRAPGKKASASDRVARQRRLRTTGRIVTPLLVLAGIAVLALGIHLGRTLFLLDSTGERALGAVAFMELKSSLHGATYYPVVEFTVQDGATVQFRDSMGSNPPAYREGDVVRVLYFTASPQQSATIDRGLLNWIVPGALCLLGSLLAIVALVARLGAPQAR
ncbi:MAG: hypothetical protein JWN85_3336 [Gammaproteobacteria bacterium]|nr:hypothetical protein [Gammaproteobacteria bacterium]